MTRRIATVAIGLTLGAGLLFGRRAYYMRLPEYSLGQIRSALAEGNRLRFERYVDVSALADQAIEAVVGRALIESVASSSGGLAALGASLGVGIVKQMQPALTAALRSSILESVESGRLDSVFAAPDRTDDEGRNINLAMVGRATAVDLYQYQGTTDVEREGDVATIGFRFRSEPLDTTLIIRARLERSEKRWRVTGLDNLDSYLAEVSELQELKLAEENVLARRRLDEIASLGDIRRWATGRSYNEFLHVRVPMTNLSSDTIVTVLVELIGLETGSVTERILILLDPPLPPNETEDVRTLKDYNPFIDWHVQMRYSSSLAPEVTYVVQTRAGTEKTTQLYGSWDEYLSEVWSQ